MDEIERIDQLMETLRRRVEALEAENARLRQTPIATNDVPAPLTGSRRQVLLGGAGLLGALAGGAVLGRATPASAATETTLAASAMAGPAGPAPEKYLSLRATLTPLKTRGVLWANHEWDLGAHFTGARPPVVVATAFDDYMEHEVAACCVCAVSVHGAPGAYRATIMVRNISAFATTVEINAVALGV
jgi:hypothetical protein